MLLDLTGGGQTYIEDCEVCCNPICIYYDVDNGTITSFRTETNGN